MTEQAKESISLSKSEPSVHPRAPGERERLIEKHARFAVLEGQNHGDSYRPTPREANLLHNMRLILRSFAAELHEAEAAAAPRSAPERDLSAVRELLAKRSCDSCEKARDILAAPGA